MGDMLIRDVPGPLKSDIARAAREDGTSLSAKAIELLRKGMTAEAEGKPEADVPAWDRIRAIYAAHDAIGDDYARIMGEIEAGRKQDFGRPVPDFE